VILMKHRLFVSSLYIFCAPEKKKNCLKGNQIAIAANQSLGNYKNNLILGN